MNPIQVILEVGEWRGFLSAEDRQFIKENGMDEMMYNGEDFAPRTG